MGINHIVTAAKLDDGIFLMICYFRGGCLGGKVLSKAGTNASTCKWKRIIIAGGN